MPESYNLRSHRKKKDITIGNCYLRNLSENTSSHVFNPRVRLERLKLLDCCEFKNSRFIIEKDRIYIKRQESYFTNKKLLLKIFCTIALLIATSLLCKDCFHRHSFGLVQKYSELLPAVQSYFSDLVYSKTKVITQFNFKWSKVNNSNVKVVLDATSKDVVSFSENSGIKNLLKDYFLELEEDEMQNNTNTAKFFIEEQCRLSLKDNSNSVVDSFDKSKFFKETNLTDYALESQGAKIVTVFDTEPYGPLAVNIFHFNIWPELSHLLINYFGLLSSNGPNSVLKPWKKPGDCWAFNGFRGRILIELSEEIIVTAVAIDHLPKEISPEASFYSAPKKFSVFGVQGSNEEMDATYLGSYEYKRTGPATQTFLIQPLVENSFKKVEISFESNHGNKNYTCVYKIRIHGHK